MSIAIGQKNRELLRRAVELPVLELGRSRCSAKLRRGLTVWWHNLLRLIL